VLLESQQQNHQSDKISSHFQHPKLEHLVKLLEQVFKTYKKTTVEDLKRMSKDYKVFITEESNPSPSMFSLRPKRILHYWAFCGGIAIEALQELGIKSFIMTSGR
jgi:hypothetical protein